MSQPVLALRLYFFFTLLIMGEEDECFDPTLDFQGQKSERFLKCNDEDSRMYKRMNHRRREKQLKSCYFGN